MNTPIHVEGLPARFTCYHNSETGEVIVKSGHKTYTKRNSLGFWEIGKYARLMAFKMIKRLIERQIVSNQGIAGG